MKLSQLISVLEDVKRYEGDKYIWSVEDLVFPCPKSFIMELVDTVERTDLGMTVGKADNIKEIEVELEYEEDVDVVELWIWDRD